MTTFTTILDSHTGLQQRIVASRSKLQELREKAGNEKALQSDGLSVFAAGSLGRLETGKKSDFDVFMIADAPDRRKQGKASVSRLEEYEVFAALIKVNESLGYPRFSGDGRFLKTYELQEMIKATGSPQDDSENLFTARILLLLESQFVTNETLYEKGTRDVIEMYFRDGISREGFKPLFLMNDLLRYWRTLCLNYEEYRHDLERPWLKKNLNLKFSRKLTIFSTVLSLLASRGNTQDSFLDLCKLTPIERLATALDTIQDSSLETGFRTALDDYESFLAAKETKGMEQDPELKASLTQAAIRFGDFIHSAIESQRVDADLRRFVLI